MFDQDAALWTECLDELQEAGSFLEGIEGTEFAIQTIISVYYKIKIKALEIGIREYEEQKNSNPEVASSPDIIAAFAEKQAMLDENREILRVFQETGELSLP